MDTPGGWVGDVRGSPGPQQAAAPIEIEDFLRSALEAGVISSDTAHRLRSHHNRLTSELAGPRSQELDGDLAAARSEAASTGARVVAATHYGTLTSEQAGALSESLGRAVRGDNAVVIRSVTKAVARELAEAQAAGHATKAPSPPRPVDPPEKAPPAAVARTQPSAATTPPRPVSRPAEQVAPSRPPQQKPPSQAPTPRPAAAAPKTQGVTERLKRALSRSWKTTTADFAANTLTYVGVLLAIVVIFVFFAFGYFGDVVSEANLRPPFFVAVPLFFFGIAWVLRTRTGIPAAATAIGLIGALSVPVMISALFRDWAPFPPDLHGSDRYWGYALAGALSALLYFYLATRQRIYAYLVAPILWAAAGALGLYWRDGVSGPQFFTVLAVIIASLAVASRWRTGAIGGLLAVPAARVGVVVAPFVFVLSLVYAYNDATQSGATQPGVADLAQPGSIAAALLAVVLGLASGMDFAWEDLGPRTRAALRASLRVLAYTAIGVALLLALGLEATSGWIGAVLVGYGLVVWAADRLVRGTGDAAIWIARGSMLIGAVLAATEPSPAVVVWSFVFIAAIGRVQSPAFRSATSPLLPAASSAGEWLTELWLPPFVVGAGLVRLVPAKQIPWVLLAAATVSMATRWLPSPLRNLRTFSGFPAIAFGIAAYASAAWVHTQVAAYGDIAAGWMMLALAGVAGFVWISWTWRAPIAAALSVAGAISLGIGVLQPGPTETVVLETTSIVAAGALLMAASFVPILSRWAYPNGLLGHICLYGAAIASVRAEDAAIVALGALVASHLIEAIAVQRNSSPFIRQAADLAGSGRSAVEGMPATVAAVAAVPLALLLGRKVPWIREERARFSLVLTGLALSYTAAALWLRKSGRWVLVLLGYLSAFGAIAVAFPSLPASLVALAGCAVATFGLASAVHRPGASILTWILALIAVVLLSSQLGVDRSDLYRPLFAASVALVGVGGALNIVRGRPARIQNPWLVPVVLVGLLGLPVSVAFALGADSWVWLLALIAAAAVAFVGWSARAGGVAAAVAAYAGIAYADVVSSRVNVFFDEPIYWMPYAAMLVLSSGALPGRNRWRLLRDPSPGALLAGLAAAAMSVTLAFQAGSEAPALGIASLILGLVWVLRRNDAWLHAGVAVLVWSGAAAGGGWLPTGLAAAAAIETALAELRSDRPEAVAYPWISVGLWATTYGFLVRWLGWSPAAIVTTTLIIAAAISGAVLTAHLVAPQRGLVGRWGLPAEVLGQVGLLGAATYASFVLERPDALLAWAGVAAVEALLVGTYATVRLDASAAWASVGLAAVSGGFLWGVLADDPVERSAAAALLGAFLLIAWAVTTLIARFPRLVLWKWPQLGLAQLVLATSATTAVVDLDDVTALGMISAIAAWEAITFSVVAGITESEPERTAYPWIAAGFWAAAYASFAGWAEWNTGRVVVVTLVIGAAASGIPLAAWLSGRIPVRARRWLSPAEAFGQMAVLGAGTYAGMGLDPSGALGAWSAAAGVEAALAAGYAAVRVDLRAAWVAAGFAAASFGMLARSLWDAPVDLVRATGIAGGAVLGMWVVLELLDPPSRAAMWRWPAFALAQAGLGAAAATAASGLETGFGSGFLAVIFGFEALLVGVAAVHRSKAEYAFLSTAFALGSFAAFGVWNGASPATTVLTWIGLTAIAAVGATLAGKGAGFRRLRLWEWPLHAATGVAASAALLSAAELLSQVDARLAGAGILAIVGASLVANRGTFAPYAPAEPIAAIALVGSAALGVSTLDAADWWTMTTLVAIGFLGAVAAPFIAHLPGRSSIAAIILAAGFNVISLAAAAALWNPLAPEVGYILIITGGALAAYGAAARRLTAFEAAVVVWLGAMLILVNSRFGLEIHANVVLVSVVLLAVLDVERYRHHHDGHPQPEPLRIAEWIAMVVPLTLAAAEMFSSLAYGLVLASEGLALIAWGGLTRVRRRAVVGLIAVTTAVLLGAMIPTFAQARSGLTGGAWLLIGAIAAVILIAAGALIEKQRTRIGQRLSQWGEILERWE